MNFFADVDEALKIPSDFGYSGKLPIGETWSLGPVIRTRDSDLLEQSNADALIRFLQTGTRGYRQRGTALSGRRGPGGLGIGSLPVALR